MRKLASNEDPEDEEADRYHDAADERCHVSLHG